MHFAITNGLHIVIHPNISLESFRHETISMEIITIFLSVGEDCFCTSAPCVDNVSMFNLIDTWAVAGTV